MKIDINTFGKIFCNCKTNINNNIEIAGDRIMEKENNIEKIYNSIIDLFDSNERKLFETQYRNALEAGNDTITLNIVSYMEDNIKKKLYNYYNIISSNLNNIYCNKSIMEIYQNSFSKVINNNDYKLAYSIIDKMKKTYEELSKKWAITINGYNDAANMLKISGSDNDEIYGYYQRFINELQKGNYDDAQNIILEMKDAAQYDIPQFRKNLSDYNVINLKNEILKDMPNNLTTIEKLRYIYIELGK